MKSLNDILYSIDLCIEGNKCAKCPYQADMTEDCVNELLSDIKKYLVGLNVSNSDKSEFFKLAFKECTNDMVNHPNHYNREGALECFEEMEMIFGKVQLAIFCKLNAYKYRYRAFDKNGAEDIKKSDFYMKKYKEIKEFSKDHVKSMIRDGEW